MKTGLVLAGGGSKGSYQMGAWIAFEELGYKFDIVCGTSIGALNGAMYAQNAKDKCFELWQKTRNHTIVKDSINIDDSSIKLVLKRMNNLLPFLLGYIHKKGVDITPFLETMDEYIDVDKIKESEIKFGVCCVSFPSLKPNFIHINALEKEKIKPYILASASCFPLFPICKIDNKSYIDGGYVDNLPINFAIKLGAKHIVAVDLSNSITHLEYFDNPSIDYIVPRVNLGNFFDFTIDNANKNIMLGYNDVMKFYNKFQGNLYTFKKVSKKSLLESNYLYQILLTNQEIAKPSYKKMVKEYNINLYKTLQNDCKAKLDAVDYFLSGFEIILSVYEYSFYEIYDYKSILKEVIDKINTEEVNIVIFSFLNKKITNQKKIELISNIDNKKILSYFNYIYKNNIDITFEHTLNFLFANQKIYLALLFLKAYYM